jgi:hypothetical protein
LWRDDVIDAGEVKAPALKAGSGCRESDGIAANQGNEQRTEIHFRAD